MRIADIQQATCDEFGLTISQLISPVRRKELSWPRSIAMALCRELTKNYMKDIAKSFRRADHTSVLNAIFRYKILMTKDEWIPRIERIRKALSRNPTLTTGE